MYTPNIPILDELISGTSTLLKLQKGLQKGYGVDTTDDLMKAVVQENILVGLDFHNHEVHFVIIIETNNAPRTVNHSILVSIITQRITKAT